jgi:formylglycine-generating enzyme required for sulfatase activity
LLTDIKHIFAFNPQRPAYRADLPQRNGNTTPLSWFDYPADLGTIGFTSDADDSNAAFAFDNETPRHRVYLQNYALASRLVTNGEYLEFIAADGYRRPEYWLSEGWNTVCQHNWQAPLYWEKIAGRWWQMTLAGLCLLDE